MASAAPRFIQGIRPSARSVQRHTRRTLAAYPKGLSIRPYVVGAMKQYQALEGFQAGAMAALQNIISKVYLLDYAVSKYHSDSPAAIRQALQTMGTQDFWWKLKFHVTPTDHFGLLAPLGANVCAMAPLGQFDIRKSATEGPPKSRISFVSTLQGLARDWQIARQIRGPVGGHVGRLISSDDTYH